MRDRDIIHIYEYYDKAGPRSVNGMPCFMSHREISKNDWEKIVKYIKQYEIRVQSFLGKEDTSPKVEEPTLFP